VIERACVQDVAFRVIAAQAKPDHATIARFVERHQAALAGVFGEVLGLCARAGLVGVNVVAVDGSKLAANASREVNVDYERLAREVIQNARELDAEEDERFGECRGDELPPQVATRNGRQQWFKEAKRRLDDQRAAGFCPMFCVWCVVTQPRHGVRPAEGTHPSHHEHHEVQAAPTCGRRSATA
jgi:hypothetical protein